MERTAWPDERLDAESQSVWGEIRLLREETRADVRGIRHEIATLKFFMLGQLATILAAVIALH